jgi:hypothetical protein
MKNKLLMAGLLAITATGGTALIGSVYAANATATSSVSASPTSPQIDTPVPGDTPDSNSTEVTNPGQAEQVDQNDATDTPDIKDANQAPDVKDSAGKDVETAD